MILATKPNKIKKETLTMENEKKVTIEEKDYKDIDILDIIAWCKEHHQGAWLKALALTKRSYTVYPRIKSTNANGKPVMIADKTKEPTIEERPISFIQIKKAFCEKFMPEKLPKAKEPKKSMYDLIAELED